MKPLQSIAMGLVVIGLVAKLGGFDLYADPVGWLLVLAGVHRLPDGLPLGAEVRVVGWIAAAVSVPLWVPAVARRLVEADPALEWAAYLPQFAFIALLCRALAVAATRADERGPAGWLHLALGLAVVVMVAPIVVFGAGIGGFADPAVLSRWLVFVLTVWLLFSYSGREWAGAPPADESLGRPRSQA